MVEANQPQQTLQNVFPPFRPGDFDQFNSQIVNWSESQRLTIVGDTVMRTSGVEIDLSASNVDKVSTKSRMLVGVVSALLGELVVANRDTVRPGTLAGAARASSPAALLSVFRRLEEVLEDHEASFPFFHDGERHGARYGVKPGWIFDDERNTQSKEQLAEEERERIERLKSREAWGLAFRSSKSRWAHRVPKVYIRKHLQEGTSDLAALVLISMAEQAPGALFDADDMQAVLGAKVFDTENFANEGNIRGAFHEIDLLFRRANLSDHLMKPSGGSRVLIGLID